MTVLRGHAVSRLIEAFGVDLTDVLRVSYPDTAKQHAAVIVVELQKEIMLAEEKAEHAVSRLRSVGYDWRDHSMILGYANDISQCADRIFILTQLLGLAIVPFRVQDNPGRVMSATEQARVLKTFKETR